MDDQRTGPAGPPARRPQAPAVQPVFRAPVPFAAPAPPPPPPKPPVWKRLTRTVRGAAGLGIGAAALLLWPFADWSVIPWLAGIGALVLLALLRLDRLLQGWVWHLAGLVVVGGLMLSTSPWAWALAGSIGVLVAGLLQLPAWRLAAVGTVLCLVSGVAFTLANVQDAREAAAAQAETNELDKGRQGFGTPIEVLPALLNRLAYGDRPEAAGAVCDNLLSAQAGAAFATSAGRPDCPSAVVALAAQMSDPNDYADAEAPAREVADGLVVDACALAWDDGTDAGPQLGRLTVGREGTGQTYIVTAFQSCDPTDS